MAVLLIAFLVAATSGAARAESPLDRLRQRSADERWQTIRPTAQQSKALPGYVTPAAAVEAPAPAPARESGRAPLERRPPTITRPIVPAPVDSPAPSSPRRTSRSDDVLPMVSDADRSFVPPVRGLFEPPGAARALSPTSAETRLSMQSPGLLPGPAGDVPRTPGGAVAPRTTTNYKPSSIHDILPYADYEPDAELAATDPLANQCPCIGCPPGKSTRHCPDEAPLPYVAHDLRSPCEIVFAWEASNLYSNPLYFDDPKLERYGHTYHPVVQPFVSTTRFGVQLLALPYKATIDPYWKRMYALGFYRPGDCAPEQIEPIPWNRDAALMQGAATTGAVFLIP